MLIWDPWASCGRFTACYVLGCKKQVMHVYLLAGREYKGRPFSGRVNQRQ